MSDGEDATRADLSGVVAALRELTAEVARLREVVSQLTTVPVSRAAAPAPLALATSAPVAESDAHLTERERCLAVVRALLAAAVTEDDDQGFAAFVKCFHSDRTDAPRAIPSLREFSWRSIRRTVASYLTVPGDASSFIPARLDPPEPSASDRSMKVFVACAGRSPVPVALKRDKAAGDAWRATDCSL